MASMQVEQAVAKKEHKANQWQNGTVASLNNHTNSYLTLDRFKNWAGYPATGLYPTTIAPNGTTRFTHVRGGHFGSVAAVQYSGNNVNSSRCAWIVAWEVPVEDAPPCPPNQVYVECGPKSMMDAITWDEIVSKLDMGSTYGCDSNSSTKTSVNATIHDSTPSVATLIVNFQLTP